MPLSLLEIYIFSLGISFLLGSINVKFRDIASIWEVIISAAFYAVPIIYPISMVADVSATAAKVLLLNPIAQAIQDIRFNLITDEAITMWNYVNNPLVMIIPIVIIVVVLIFGAIVFRRKSKYFAEEA